MNKQVVSKQRVAAHGEVYTHEREVNAMLDLVKNETERIDSRFLEPACGHGNFLAEILRRKIAVVNARYGKSQLEWERSAVLAVSSVYGIELLEDNVLTCRVRLLQMFETEYEARFGSGCQRACNEAVRFILEQNIVWGDALSFRTVDGTHQPLVLPEWSLASGSFLKRRDFMFSFLVEQTHQFALFNDQNEPASISQPVRDYPLVHFLEVGQLEPQTA